MKKIPISHIIKAPKLFITGKKKDKDIYVNQLHIVNNCVKNGKSMATEKEFEARVEMNDMLYKSATKQLITQTLKESREGKGTLSLQDIAGILKEVLSVDEIITLVIHLKQESWTVSNSFHEWLKIRK
uniref:Uncharacterized protein n=1 Tax=viral metagenome TaxID=1070528 RepID=A0A6M3LEY5_9ZZZZ